MANKINSYRNIVYTLELDWTFPTNNSWGGSAGIQCSIMISVNTASLFLPSFIPIIYISPYDVLGTKNNSEYDRKNSLDFVDLVKSMREWGESRNLSNLNKI